MSEDLRSFSPSLSLDQRGFWATPSREPEPVSYPSAGNDDCFEVEDGSFWFRHRNAILTDVLTNFPPDGAIFDIGGGNGYVAKGLDAAGFPCVLVEPGLAGATHAVNRGVRNVIWSTLESANFRAGSLPAAGLFDVVEHIEADGRFLKQLHGLLRPQARIYLTVPAFETLWSTDDVYAGHYRRYSRGSLSAALQKAGFVMEYVSCFFWFLAVPVFTLRAVPSFLGLRKASLETARRDHAAGPGRLSHILDWVMKGERNWIQGNRRIPFGSSCVAVARRVGSAG